MDFLYLFSNGKSDGPGPRRSTTRGPGGAAGVLYGLRRHGQKGAAAPCRRAGTRARGCSPVAVEEDKPNEAVPEGWSLENERRRRGGATEARIGGGLSSARG
jgi:hypothetical protein